MNQRLLLLLLFVILTGDLPQGRSRPPPSAGDAVTIKPSFAVIIGVLSLMLCLTILLLIYAKFCQNPRQAVGIFTGGDEDPTLAQARPPRSSGVDRTIVESLPFFRFSSLKGAKKGLECSVCLCQFDSSEMLRLLPKCKHPFHIDCIDLWLKSHSSCPLCRQKVERDDVHRTLSSRILWNGSDITDETAIELIVQREDAEHSKSSSFAPKSFSIENLRRMPEKQNATGFVARDLRFKHRIIISDVLHKHRWSDIDSSDLMLLNPEILGGRNHITGKPPTGRIRIRSRDSCPETDMIKSETESKRQSDIKRISRLRPTKSHFASSSSSWSFFPAGMGQSTLLPRKRTMSETVCFSPFADLGARLRNREVNTKEEKVKRMWLTIARRTIRWLTRREDQNLANSVHSLV